MKNKTMNEWAWSLYHTKVDLKLVGVEKLSELIPEKEIYPQLHYREGELEEIAIFAINDKDGENELSGEDLTQYTNNLAQGATNTNFYDVESMKAFLSEFGPFTYDYTYWNIWGGYGSVTDEKLAKPICRKYGNTKVVVIEPMWLLARRLCLYKATGELIKHLWNRHFSKIEALSGFDGPHKNFKDVWYQVRFNKFNWLKEPLLFFMSHDGWPREIEPKTANHIALAAWEYAAHYFQTATQDKVQVCFSHKMPKSLARALSKDAEYLVSRPLLPQTAEVSTGLFDYNYLISSNEALLAFMGLSRVQKLRIFHLCPICGNYFVPANHNKKYCNRCLANESATIKGYTRALKKMNLHTCDGSESLECLCREYNLNEAASEAIRKIIDLNVGKLES